MAAEILVVNGSPRPEGNSARVAALCGEVFDRRAGPGSGSTCAP